MDLYDRVRILNRMFEASETPGQFPPVLNPARKTRTKSREGSSFSLYSSLG